MRFVGVRELKNRTGEVLGAVERGEKVVVTRRGKPLAAITALREEDVEAFAREESRAWLRLAGPAFAFWDNAEDEAWDAL